MPFLNPSIASKLPFFNRRPTNQPCLGLGNDDDDDTDDGDDGDDDDDDNHDDHDGGGEVQIWHIVD